MGSRLYRLTRSLQHAASTGADVGLEFDRQLPALAAQVRVDADVPQLLQLWGQSSNCDELAGETIVHPGILRAIGELARVPMRSAIVHAGLIHTYGYLLSNLETTYGFKRARYEDRSLARALGVRRDLLGPTPRQGTLLQNLTHALGRLVFAEDSRERRVLDRYESPIGVDCSQVRRTSVVERVSHVDGVAIPAIELRTDLFHSEAGTVLVYSIRKKTRWGHRLVTAFPVPADYLKRAAYEGPPRLRYNASLRGLAGRRLRGRREFRR